MQKSLSISRRLLSCLAVALLGLGLSPSALAQQRAIVDPELKPVQIGMASYYSSKFNGQRTASGEIFSNNKLTAASNHFPIGTFVRVRNLKNNKSVIVRINDRMHYRNHRAIDLTHEAARQLGMIRRGIAKVKVEFIPSKFYDFFGVTPEMLLLAMEK